MKTFFRLIAAVLFCSLSSVAFGQTISGTVDYEDLFIRVFSPGTGDGISIDTNNDLYVGNEIVGSGTSLSNTGFEDVDLDGDGSLDVRVNVAYALQKSTGGDSRIGIRQNTAGTAVTLFSDSGAGVDFDSGFLSVSFDVASLQSGFEVSQIQDLTTSSLNGETELYEFGIIDAGVPDLTLADIAAYNAQDYDGGDDNFSGATNSLGDDDEILLPEFLGSIPSVTYDAEATITGDLGDNPDTLGDATDFIDQSGVGISQVTLFYGGFDVGTDTNVGSPSGSFNFSGETVLVAAVPEPSSLTFLGLVACGIFARRRR